MCNSWIRALGMFDWVVNLKHFRNANNYFGYFNRIIQPNKVVQFENAFRTSINDGGSFAVAGEVCFWKNYGNAQARDRVTQNLLSYLFEQENWNLFICVIRETSNNPSFENFVSLQNACKQLKGFATPITFLSFYRPSDYPMVDKHIANWWNLNRANYGLGASLGFRQRKIDGWIPPNKYNWQAYIAWKGFCCDYSVRIQRNCGLDWRARDVEIAIWMSQKSGLFLNALQ